MRSGIVIIGVVFLILGILLMNMGVLETGHQQVFGITYARSYLNVKPYGLIAAILGLILVIAGLVTGRKKE